MIPKSRRAIVSTLLLATLLLGLAQVALLPPWEGFDETAHFSYVQQIADIGTWPQGTEPLSVDVEASSRKTPAGNFLRPWGSYDAFKTVAPEVLEAARRELHDAPATPRTWRAGQALNWQNQHPLLYYALLAPVHWMTKGWSLASELFAMRAVSYLIAWLGLVIAAVAALRSTQPTPTATLTVALAVGLWPLIFPMWFPEMARVGNDSLLVPIVAAAWILAQPLVRQEGSALRYAALGAILGLGLLTKATVLPVVAVISVFVAWPLLLALRGGKSFWPPARKLLLMLAAMCLIAGWWYGIKLARTGTFIGSYDVMAMHARGGLLAGIRENASAWVVARIPWVFGITFLWGGTWSFILPPVAAILPLAATTIVLAIGYWRFATAHRLSFADHVPLMAGVALLAALFYHSLVLMSVGPSGAPAHYVHSFAAILAPAVGFGIAGALSRRWLAVPLLGLLLYPLFFLIIAAAVQAMIFAGCGHISPTGGYYPISSIAECATQWPAIHRNLTVISFPKTALVLFAAGWIVALIGLVSAVRAVRAEITAPSRKAAHARFAS